RISPRGSFHTPTRRRKRDWSAHNVSSRRSAQSIRCLFPKHPFVQGNLTFRYETKARLAVPSLFPRNGQTPYGSRSPPLRPDGNEFHHPHHPILIQPEVRAVARRAGLCCEARR